MTKAAAGMSARYPTFSLEEAHMIRSTLVIVVAMFLSSLALAQNEEAYSAVALGTGGSVGARSLSFDFRINQYASDDEVDALAQLLKDKGQDALRRELEKRDVGRINPVGTVGNQVAVARKHQTPSGTVIILVTARNMPFVELYRNSRTTDYPFGFLQIKLDSKGEGSGQIMVAAKIRFNKKKGHYEIESYGNQYIKAVNVRPLK